MTRRSAVLTSAATLAALISGPVEARKAAVPVCVPAAASFSFVRFENGLVEPCTTDSVCLELDPALRQWQLLPALQPPVVTPATLAPCAGSGSACAPLVLPGLAPATADTPRQIAWNSDHSLVAVVEGPGPVRVFDVATRAQLYTVAPQKLGMGDSGVVSGVEFAGAALYVRSAASPVSSAGRLYAARTGKVLLDIGGKPGAEVDEISPAALGGDRYAFGTWQMGSLYVIDTRRGKVITHASLGGSAKKPLGSLLLLAVTAAGTVIAVGSAPEQGVQLVDPGSGKRTTIAVPRC